MTPEQLAEAVKEVLDADKYAKLNGDADSDTMIRITGRTIAAAIRARSEKSKGEAG